MGKREGREEEKVGGMGGDKGGKTRREAGGTNGNQPSFGVWATSRGGETPPRDKRVTCLRLVATMLV